MIPYLNLASDSAVRAYKAGDDYILIKYNSGDLYLYSYASTGKEEVQQMKKLAMEGRGLSTFISQKIREKYEKRYKAPRKGAA